MALAVVQQGDSGGTAIASGSAGVVLGSNSTVTSPAHLAVLSIVVANHLQTVSSVTSSIGATWTRAASVALSVAEIEIWTAPITGAATTATVTTSGGATWLGQCTEVSGGVSSVVGSATTNTTANPSLTISSIASGDLVVALSAIFASFSGGPSAPWVDYNTGGFTLSIGQDVAYSPISGTSTTVTWTATAQSWAIAAVALAPSVVASGNNAFFALV